MMMMIDEAERLFTSFAKMARYSKKVRGIQEYRRPRKRRGKIESIILERSSEGEIIYRFRED